MMMMMMMMLYVAWTDCICTFYAILVTESRTLYIEEVEGEFRAHMSRGRCIVVFNTRVADTLRAVIRNGIN